MLLQIAEFCSILWQSGIPFYICTTSSLSIYLLMDIYAVFLSWPLCIMVLWTLGYNVHPRAGVPNMGLESTRRLLLPSNQTCVVLSYEEPLVEPFCESSGHAQGEKPAFYREVTVLLSGSMMTMKMEGSQAPCETVQWNRVLRFC